MFIRSHRIVSISRKPPQGFITLDKAARILIRVDDPAMRGMAGIFLHQFAGAPAQLRPDALSKTNDPANFWPITVPCEPAPPAALTSPPPEQAATSPGQTAPAAGPTTPSPIVAAPPEAVAPAPAQAASASTGTLEWVVRLDWRPCRRPEEIYVKASDVEHLRRDFFRWAKSFVTEPVWRGRGRPKGTTKRDDAAKLEEGEAKLRSGEAKSARQAAMAVCDPASTYFETDVTVVRKELSARRPLGGWVGN